MPGTRLPGAAWCIPQKALRSASVWVQRVRAFSFPPLQPIGQKMKMLICLLFTATLAAKAQTNTIVFPQLLSATNSVLMTNAEFRLVSGNRIFFENEAGEKWFHATNLDASVLITLKLDPKILEANQAKLDGDLASLRAEQLRSAKAAAIANAAAEKKAQQDYWIRQSLGAYNRGSALQGTISH